MYSIYIWIWNPSLMNDEWNVPLMTKAYMGVPGIFETYAGRSPVGSGMHIQRCYKSRGIGD